MDSKRPWESKTNWIAVVMAVAAFFPGIKVFIAANPDLVVQGMALVFAFLRIISSGKIDIKGEKPEVPEEPK